MSGEGDGLQRAIDDARARISADTIVELAKLMVETESPPGGESPLAEAVRDWGSRAQPGCRWWVDLVTEDSGSLVSRSARGPRAGGELAFYSHLDSAVAHGGEAPSGRFSYDPSSRVLQGYGMCVAKAPAAAATVAFCAAAATLHDVGRDHRLTLMLAAGGIHRAVAPPAVSRQPWMSGFGSGVQHLLRSGVRPTATINVKAGPLAILREEPGAMYLHLELRCPARPVIEKSAVEAQGGAIALVGSLLEAIDDWRTAFLGRDDAAPSQIAREVVVGAVCAGDPNKPDAPAKELSAYLYVVAGIGDDPTQVADELEAQLVGTLAAQTTSISVRPYAFMPAGATPASAPIVGIAQEVWATRRADGPSVASWKGSTDGALLRSVGIDTVRIGPPLNRDPDDPRLELVDLDEMLELTEIYTEIAIRFAWVSGENAGVQA